MRIKGTFSVAVAVVCAGVLLAALTVDARAASLIRPPPGTPDPRQMVLTGADLDQAKVTSQGYYKDADFPSVISYSRELQGGTVGRTALIDVTSEAEIGTSTASTATYLRTIKRVFASKQGRALLKKSFAGELPSGGLVSHLQIGKPQDLGVGQDSFDLPLSIRVLGLRTELHLAAFRVEPVLGSLIAVGAPGDRVPRSAMAHLAQVMVGRMSAQLLPRNTVLPTITGTAQAAQTLTATPGTWSGAAATYTYQWQHCDSSGANCADIAAEIGQSYLVASMDVGATIRVTVRAQSALGSATAVSVPTAVVVPAPASARPANTSPPTISGTLHVGETLTAMTGSWTGNPTSFSFVWQRCDTTSTPSCFPTGGHSQTYVLSTADLGSRMLVYVMASNAAGGASARSAMTPEVT